MCCQESKSFNKKEKPRPLSSVVHKFMLQAHFWFKFKLSMAGMKKLDVGIS